MNPAYYLLIVTATTYSGIGAGITRYYLRKRAVRKGVEAKLPGFYFQTTNPFLTPSDQPYTPWDPDRH